MIQVVSEYVVKEEDRGQFELAYGPGGEWSKLFDQYPGFRGTTLMRDIDNPRRYLTIDYWDDAANREKVIAERTKEHASLEAAFRRWTESGAQLGSFRMLAEATVRPRARARGGKGGAAGLNMRRGGR